MRVFRSLALVVGLATSVTAIALPGSAEERTPRPHAEEPLFEQVDLAHSGEGAHTYRIPALEKLPDGTLLAAYDRRNDGAGDLPGDIDVLVRRSEDGGRTWSEPVVVAGGDTTVGSGDPSLIVDDETGRVHLFYATGNGFRNSGPGNDNDDPNLIHLDYSYSDDGGRTWTERRLTEEVKDPSWYGIFASSGTGIQVKHGPFAGRLIQQYAFRKDDGSIWAVSAYSDDHGETWRAGEPVGPLMDENKTVELADGRIMLNSRTAGGDYRLVAYSTNGGVTYSSPIADDELVDPTNNAAIIRYDENATTSDPRSHWLMFSNTADPDQRRNLTVRMSCNDGESWPIAKTVESGAAGYSTLVELGNDSFGLLYERGAYEHLTFVRFNAAWLGADCPADGRNGLRAEIRGTDLGEAGRPGTVEVTVTNHGHLPSVPDSLTLDVPEGWTAEAPRQSLPALDPGADTVVSFPLTPGSDVRTGEYTLTWRVGTAGMTARATVPVLGGDATLDTGPARDYDGVDDFTDLTAALPSVRDLTEGAIVVDVRTSATQLAGALLSASDTGAPSTNLTVSLNSGVPYFEVRQDSRYLVRTQGSTSIADGDRHTVVVFTDATGTRVHVDGVRAASSEDSGFFGHLTGLDGLWVGRNVDDAGPQWHFGGHIERVRVYGAEL
ncbi:exo-alpha-sialidase [Saccharomonospora glauca]|uniref:exo-alpha-sialidase n=1 Tax=Saccharomonospora glauca K62 TaxID=928724 RepID=I1D1T5_9PSEU|nr:exo-alpha-sialidase [Saccharomonospora glauca]EIE98909.1 laminin G domain-containing protein,alpha-galactosidase family protein,BNR/Asp-box repeat protein [Saccharomonospora glauca K62]